MHNVLPNSRAYRDALLRECKKRDVTIYTSMRVDHLLRNAAGEIVGASADGAKLLRPTRGHPRHRRLLRLHRAQGQVRRRGRRQGPAGEPEQHRRRPRTRRRGRRRPAADGPPLRGPALRPVHPARPDQDAALAPAAVEGDAPGRRAVAEEPARLRHPRRPDQLDRAEQHDVPLRRHPRRPGRGPAGERGLGQAHGPGGRRQRDQLGVHDLRRPGGQEVLRLAEPRLHVPRGGLRLRPGLPALPPGRLPPGRLPRGVSRARSASTPRRCGPP